MFGSSLPAAVLFIQVLSQGGYAVTQTEFEDMVACYDAAREIRDTFESVSTVCAEREDD
jgi:hypothetical protein